jgi:hypothetical protein
MSATIEDLPNELLLQICIYSVHNEYKTLSRLYKFKLVCARFYNVALKHPLGKTINNIMIMDIFDNKKYINNLELILKIAKTLTFKKTETFINETINNNLIALGLNMETIEIRTDMKAHVSTIRIALIDNPIFIHINRFDYYVRVHYALYNHNDLHKNLHIFKNIMPEGNINNMPSILEKLRQLHYEVYY